DLGRAADARERGTPKRSCSTRGRHAKDRPTDGAAWKVGTTWQIVLFNHTLRLSASCSTAYGESALSNGASASLDIEPGSRLISALCDRCAHFELGTCC